MAPDFKTALDRRELDAIHIPVSHEEIDRLLGGEVLRFDVRDMESETPASIVFLRLKARPSQVPLFDGAS